MSARYPTEKNLIVRTTAMSRLKHKIGVGAVIKGGFGVVAMKVGAKENSLFQQALAMENKVQVPFHPNSTLIFEVELVG